MTGLASVTAVGEHLVTLLSNRRDAAPASDLPAAFDIRQVPIGALGSTLQTGLTVTCVQMRQSAMRLPPRAPTNPTASPPLGLELSFLIAASSPMSGEEQALIAWAMQAIHREPILDASGASVIDLIQSSMTLAELGMTWRALGLDYRLSFMVEARGVILTDPPPPPLPINTRLGHRG